MKNLTHPNFLIIAGWIAVIVLAAYGFTLYGH